MPNQVNLDDELFEPDEEAKAAAAAAKKKKKGKKAKEEEDKALGAAELEFDEFCEIVARTCNEKVREAFRPHTSPNLSPDLGCPPSRWRRHNEPIPRGRCPSRATARSS